MVREILDSIVEAEKRLSAPAKWIVTIFIATLLVIGFIIGVCVSSNSYDYRYPAGHSWYVDHQMLHYPGVEISRAGINTTCKQDGNIYPPSGDNVTQIQWLGGRDAGFVGNFKVVYDNTTIIVPTPKVGECIYIYDVKGDVVVYGQDITSTGWTRVGSNKKG